MACGESNGDPGGTGECSRRWAAGDGERDSQRRFSEDGDGELRGDGLGEVAGVESGDSSSMSQNSSLMSGVDPLVVLSLLAAVARLGVDRFDVGGVKPSRRGGVRLSRFLRDTILNCGLVKPVSEVMELRFSILVADRRRFWFLMALLKLSSR